jgi:hypothetical protein
MRKDFVGIVHVNVMATSDVHLAKVPDTLFAFSQLNI